jgi:NAD(P)H-dependent FMN reductase
MKLLGINASHRGERGITARLLARLGEGALQAGAEFETLALARLKINRCLSCHQCQEDKHHLQCVYHDKDDARIVFDHMAGADLLIFATPIYMMTMSGLMKNLLDRTYCTMDVSDARMMGGLIHHHVNPAISQKPFVTLLVCSNLETLSWRNAAEYFRIYARFMEARQAGLLVRNASDLFVAQGAEAMQRRFPKIPQVWAAFEQAGRELAERGAVSPQTARRASQEVIPVPFSGLLKRLPWVRRRVVQALNDPSFWERES